MSLSADSTQVRFIPAVEKTFSVALARKIGDQVRAIAITGMGGDPAAEMDITVSPDMSAFRMGNKGKARNVDVKSFAIVKSTNTPVNNEIKGLSVAAKHRLDVTVTVCLEIRFKLFNKEKPTRSVA